MIKFTALEFRNRFDYEPSVKMLPTEVENAFIDDVCEQVRVYLRSKSITFNEEDLTTWEQSQLKLIQMEQALYVLNNGRLDRTSGVDAFGEQASNVNVISPMALQIAKRSGFLYRGF